MLSVSSACVKDLICFLRWSGALGDLETGGFRGHLTFHFWQSKGTERLDFGLCYGTGIQENLLSGEVTLAQPCSSSERTRSRERAEQQAATLSPAVVVLRHISGDK